MGRDKVKFYQDKSGEFRWNHKSSNGNILADSGECYRNLQDCIDGFESHINGIIKGFDIEMYGKSSGSVFSYNNFEVKIVVGD